jgi:menaquinone-9 beta-reductase
MTTTTSLRFDAVVVGAGVAGASAAIWLARAGWRVALVEKQRFPRRKVCGECIAASNLPLLRALGIGSAFEAAAGPELRQVRLVHQHHDVLADLPAALHPAHPQQRWGRALSRETLDTLLLDQARLVGAAVMQPCSVQAITGVPGAWRCEVRGVESAASQVLQAPLVIDAHGSWQDWSPRHLQRHRARNASDLFAFKANFLHAQIAPGEIDVLALPGAYGGMVLEGQDTSTLACCVRRDTLHQLRSAAPGERAGDVVQAWLQRECSFVQRALQGAVRVGPWLASGPIAPGVRLSASDAFFSIGNAAGEAHPILGEGMSMALQSSALLCGQLLAASGLSPALGAATQALLQHCYAADWRQHFAPRLRVAALFAHVAMRPVTSHVLMAAVRAFPDLLTQGARWGGKVRSVPAPQQDSADHHPAPATTGHGASSTPVGLSIRHERRSI